MTHRIGRVPAINPFLDNPDPLAGDNVLDLSPGEHFQINRRINNLYLRSTPGSDRATRLVLNWWQEQENGNRHLMFRAASGSVPGLPTTRKATIGTPVDHDTTELALGPDVKIGSAVVNYRCVNTHFRDDAKNPGPGSPLDFSPLNTLTHFKATTNSRIVKARAKITDRLQFTGAYINRERENTTASLVNPVAVSLQSINAALVYRATDALCFTGRYRRFDQNNHVGFLFDSGGAIDNQHLSHESSSAEIEATYTGIFYTFVRLNYERLDTDRSLRTLHSVHDEFEHPHVTDSSKSDIYRASLRFHPGTRFTFSSRFELSDTSGPGFPSLPTDRQRFSANATYLLANNLALYGDYSKWKENNDIIRVPFGSIPVSPPDPTTAPYGDLRADAAGQGFRNDSTIATIGTWYALSSRLVFDAYYAQSSMDTDTLWIIGTSSSVPHIPATVAQFQADMNQFSVGATYVLNRKTRLYGRFLDSLSKGRTLLNTADFPAGIGPTWTPVDVRQEQWTVGLGYELGLKDSLQADFSLGDWEDAIDSANDGTFKLWRLAWTHQF